VASGTGVWLDLNTVSGSTRSNLDMNQGAPPAGGHALTLRVATVSGDITINRVAVAARTPAAPEPADTASEPTDD
jgi:hypothetical protein